MTWHPIGLTTVGANDREVSLGRFAGVLPGGVLHLQLRYAGEGSPDLLSFCIVDFLDDDGARSLGSDRWWPKAQPSAVRLGPGVVSEVAGTVLLRPRTYNLQWLKAGLPAPTLPVSVSAWLPDGLSFPYFVPRGFAVGAGFFDVAGDPVGPGGAHAVGPADE
jgi:hypothetical protein